MQKKGLGFMTCASPDAKRGVGLVSRICSSKEDEDPSHEPLISNSKSKPQKARALSPKPES